MPTSPPAISHPPNTTPIIGPDKRAATQWQQWFTALFKRVGGGPGMPIVGDFVAFEATVSQASLASGGSVALIDAKSGEQWKVRGLLLSGGGTNFSGGGGDRLLSITDGTSTWSVIPAATLQALAAARWGDTGLPFPATAAHLTTASAAGIDITAQYSGGATDYTAGSCTIVVMAERTA